MLLLTKICTTCRKGKTLGDFHKNSRNEDGRHAQCKECRKVFSTKHKERLAEKDREYRLKNKFGLTVPEYDNLFETQLGCCAICGVHQDSLSRRLAVDHCHDSGKVRGLLCSNCNTGIGNLRDSIELLQKGVIYLERYQ